ncbi:gamma-butyrolactone biosynthesis enzyme [Streptomyces sp. APSN-46.1]|uniref:ScbA/BarX family gamma-butyrolactone biosynthesis protein n=1 Tax=Streptomyces sp. APSN-46.1 TaxID=2929049 RepID=UPI001FB35162|nr:ScbA/BarX family gamma-butyrolactone biosynthesis protein [Streptomyces sp. APSN-46.1]MCJ1680086.1 gamma-butyrolactone biosynthesis enzyme [Streptomyces sp. APSN-46.1]
MLSSAQAPRIDGAPVMSPLLTTTVPRGYVHRASVAEVLLTGWDTDTEASADASDAFVVRAQWPRSHALFTPAHGHQDPLLLIESIRQAGTLLTHTEYGVPFGHQFLMWDMFFDATPAAFATSSTPTDVELHTTCHDIVRRGRSISGMRYDVTVRRDGLPVATGGARFSCTSPAVHRRLRGERPTTTGRALPAPVDPADVGHTNREHVVLAPPVPARANRWELRVDTDHAVFFDHPIDHVPGMLLIEAARQAARAATRQPDALLVGLESNFIRYAELDAPCWIEAHVERAETAEELRVHVRGTQEGEQVFTSDLVLRRPAG